MASVCTKLVGPCGTYDIMFTIRRIDVTKRIRCNTIPDHSVNLAWWCDGRLVHAGAKDNIWVKMSRLLKTCRFMKELALPPSTSLVNITSLSPTEDLTQEVTSKDAWFRAAQKGPHFAKEALSGLMEGVPFNPDSVLAVVDLTPHAGDRALGLRLWAKERSAKAYYLGMGVKNQLSAKACNFAKARVARAGVLSWPPSLAHGA